MKKKIMAILLACTMAAGLAVSPVGTETVRADEAFITIGEMTYRVDGDTVAVYRGGGTGEVTIPESVNGKTVTSIDSNAFSNWCTDMTGINIPSTVTSIGQDAFDRSGLISINIPSTVTSMGNSVFSRCKNLKSVTIGSGVTSISKQLFFECESLESVTIGSGVTSIENAAFIKCSGLESINIPSGVTSIGDSAFSDCSSLKSINLPSTVTSIGEHAFTRCKALKSIELPSGITSIGYGTFYMSGLTSINIPSGVTSIGDHAFNRCTNLTSVSIPSSVTNIAQGAFWGCTSLKSIRIPSGVTSIAATTFHGGTSLTSIYIPSSVKSIESSAFVDTKKLKDVYYGGSEKQWNKIKIVSTGNKYLKSAKIHYNSTGEDSKSEQTITAKDIIKTYGAKPFKLNAKSSVGAALTYAVSNKNVATVDKNGKVTIKGCGITNITITAKKKGDYSQAKKTIKLTVKPKKMALSSVKSTKKSTAAVKWRQDKKASGYIIQCATDSKFKNGKVQMTISKNKTVSATVKKLKAGKKYYVRVCAYAKSGKTKVQGDWSKVKTVKVKK